ncbi:MAG TPA: hypothetical protein EYG86_04835 [Crocinitomicaceae bacterium]|nr:hypothetical protein [Crocinitomicaceae bacterium]
MDIKDILENDTVKGLLTKFGVSDEQAQSVAKQAMSSMQSKFTENPKQMSSLLSDNENTEDDVKMAAEIEDDFVQNLIKKVGLPDSIAGSLKGAIPGILSQFTGKLSSDGKNDEGGIAGIFSSITDMFDGDDAKDAASNTAAKATKSSGGIAGLFSKLFGK